MKFILAATLVAPLLAVAQSSSSSASLTDNESSIVVSASSSSASSSVVASATASSASAAAASSSSSAASSALIPSTVSSTCQAFLSELNTDSTLSSCVTPLLTLTSAAADVSANSNATSLSTSLKKLCAANGCSATTLRSKLTQFYGNCTDELNGPEGSYDETVRGIYDILYVVHPLKEVVCTKDATSGEYCVTALSSNVTTSVANSTISSNSNATVISAIVIPNEVDTPEHVAAQYLSVQYSPETAPAFVKRAEFATTTTAANASSSAITYPNSTTYRNTNLPYLFIQNDSAASVICSSCAAAVFSAYATWEINTPYALGLSASPILGGQSSLWKGATGTCGSTWTNKIQAAAIGSSADDSSTGSSSSGLLSAAQKEMASKGGVWGTLVGVLAVGAGMVLAV